MISTRYLGIFFYLTAVPPTVAQSRVALNLNTHSQVEIDRPAAAIWPHILDPNPWKQGLKLTHHAGPAGQVGEILGAPDPSNRGAAAFYAENVEVVPNQRRTIKLYEPSGRLLGFAIWTLTERNGRTLVEYDVYSETLLPPELVRQSKEALAEQERQSFDSNKKRFDDELVALKRLVESR
jgi:hypothetical protein